ncbi:MAG: hypothetical protein LBH90_01510 [Tannerella sp.]|jgi:hypothetical protein|nr:hypothetical protein [Tannerella sp.]
MTLQQQPIQTPLAKLQHKKESVRRESELQIQKLEQHLLYVKENAGSLVLSGISSLLLPGSKTSPKKGKVQQSLPAQATHPFGLLNYLSLGKEMLPVALEIAQPFLITWGLKTVKKLITRIFFKKKK